MYVMHAIIELILPCPFPVQKKNIRNKRRRNKKENLNMMTNKTQKELPKPGIGNTKVQVVKHINLIENYCLY